MHNYHLQNRGAQRHETDVLSEFGPSLEALARAGTLAECRRLLVGMLMNQKGCTVEGQPPQDYYYLEHLIFNMSAGLPPLQPTVLPTFDHPRC